MTAFQQKPYSVVFKAVAPVTGLGVTGLLFSAATVQYWPAQRSAYQAKTLAAADWQDLGLGYYRLFFAPAELAATGNFTYTVAAPGMVPVLGSFDVDPQPTAFLAAPGICVVTGNIIDLCGKPGTGLEINFRAAASPSSVSGSLLAGGLIRTTPDAYGNFSVALVQGAALLIEIDGLGIRQGFTVPAQTTASLMSLLPPL